MRYLLLIYTEPPAVPQTEAEVTEELGRYFAYTGWLRDTGQFLGGEALQPVTDATTVQVVDDRRVVTDGPFAETKEHLGGYYLIEAPDLDAAIEAAARLPAASYGKVEVRPIWETPGSM
jgi:hypothetical protein